MLHCIKIANAKVALFDTDVVSNIEEIKNDLTKEQDIKLVEWRDGFSLADKEGKSGGKKSGDWDVLEKSKWDSLSDERIPNDARAGLTWKDAACYIYTSFVLSLFHLLPSVEACLQGYFWAAEGRALYAGEGRHCGSDLGKAFVRITRLFRPPSQQT